MFGAKAMTTQKFSLGDTTPSNTTTKQSYKQKITCCSKCALLTCQKREQDGTCYLILEDGEKITKAGWLHS